MVDTKLITFIHVAKLKSYTKTAELLNLTQPAVTQHIKQLEEYYGVQLVAKKGKQFYLTTEGGLLLEYAEDLEAKSYIIKRMLQNKSALTKRYNIGATMTIGEFVLPALLGQYKHLHNNIDIIMHVYNSDEVLKRLMQGEYDLCIVEGPFDKKKFNYRKMCDDELVLVVSPDNSIAGKEPVEMNEIIYGGGLILREKGSGTRMVFENRLLEMGYDLSTVNTFMEVGSIGAIKSLVEANLGYTVISKVAVKREVEAETLRIVPILNVRIMREFNFVFLDNRPVEFADEFMSFLTKK